MDWNLGGTEDIHVASFTRFWFRKNIHRGWDDGRDQRFDFGYYCWNCQIRSRGHIVYLKAIFTVSVINILWAIGGGGKGIVVTIQRLRNYWTVSTNLSEVLGYTVMGNLSDPEFLIRLSPFISKRLGVNTDVFIPVRTTVN